MMKKTIITTLAVLLAVSLFAQRPAHSRVETKTIKSEVLGADRDYTIFLPKSFDTEPDKKYPILYLLHGMWETNTVWFERGHVKDVMDALVESGEACEMIIVSPNAGGNINNGIWNGYFDMPGWKYETFFFTEFLPYIEKTYRVIGNKQNRAVSGLSMGGGGAASYAQRHTDLFCAAYPMGALMSIPGGDVNPQLNSDNEKLVLLTQSVIDRNCSQYVAEADDQRKEQLRSVKWFVDCGDDDFLLDRNIEFFQAMRRAGIPCEFRVRNGGHVWEYWHSGLYTCLPFVSRTFSLQ